MVISAVSMLDRDWIRNDLVSGLYGVWCDTGWAKGVWRGNKTHLARWYIYVLSLHALAE